MSRERATFFLTTSLIVCAVAAIWATKAIANGGKSEDATASITSSMSWYDHFDGQTCWTINGEDLCQPTSGWQAAGPWSNGAPFANIWLPGHVELPVEETLLGLRLDDADDTGQPCLPNNPNCTHNGTTYPYASAEYRTVDRFGHGCFQARLQAVAADGVVTAFFLYQDVPPYDDIPEIDWEIFGNSYAGGANEGIGQINYFDGSGTGHEQHVELGFDPTAAFHTYAIEWLPGESDASSRIAWFVDGVQVGVSAESNFNADLGLKMMLNLWPTDTSWSEPGTFTGADLPLHARFDWVSYTPGAACQFDSGPPPYLVYLPIVFNNFEGSWGCAPDDICIPPFPDVTPNPTLWRPR